MRLKIQKRKLGKFKEKIIYGKRRKGYGCSE
jgi:hypothetical protein